jgi:Fe-S oxidoreductase
VNGSRRITLREKWSYQRPCACTLRNLNESSIELPRPEEGCGFSGMFSVKIPHISGALARDTIERRRESGADIRVANDCGCLMQLGGAMHREAYAPNATSRRNASRSLAFVASVAPNGKRTLSPNHSGHSKT